MMLSLIVFAILAPEPCAGSDLACIARDSMREANAATDPRDRAEALLTAARAHLGLYRKTDDRAELCKAQRLIPRKHTEHLGDVPRATRADVKAELARLGHDCKLRSQRPTPTPTAIAPSPASSPPEATTPPPAPSSAPASAIVGEPLEALVASPAADETRGDALIDVDRHTKVVRPAEGRAAAVKAVEGADARGPAGTAGRRLFIAGGVLVGGAAMAGGLAAFAAARADGLATEQNSIAATTHAQGFTDPASRRESERLAAGVAQWEHVLLGASLACAVVGSTAVALLTAGAVKRRRAARVVVAPGFAGLLWSARF